MVSTIESYPHPLCLLGSKLELSANKLCLAR